MNFLTFSSQMRLASFVIPSGFFVLFIIILTYNLTLKTDN
jgi:hypothetical protein